jgi:hypothetical protein
MAEQFDKRVSGKVVYSNYVTYIKSLYAIFDKMSCGPIHPSYRVQFYSEEQFVQRWESWSTQLQTKWLGVFAKSVVDSEVKAQTQNEAA